MRGTLPETIIKLMKSKKPEPKEPLPDLPIAIISDIHGNLAALEAVLKDIELLGVEIVVCLGDTVGYGKEGASCVDLVRRHCVFSLLGNHEVMLCGFKEAALRELPEHMGVPLLETRAKMDAEALAWCKALPLDAEMDPLGFSHASRHDPAAFHYIFEPKDAVAHFAATPLDATFFGHTHIPVIWQEAEGDQPFAYEPDEMGVRLDPRRRHAINVGSVGLPRDGDPRPCYVIFNPASRILVFRRLKINPARKTKTKLIKEK